MVKIYLLLRKLYLLVISTGMSKEMFRILEQPLEVRSLATDLDIFKAFAPWTVQMKTWLNFNKFYEAGGCLSVTVR